MHRTYGKYEIEQDGNDFYILHKGCLTNCVNYKSFSEAKTTLDKIIANNKIAENEESRCNCENYCPQTPSAQWDNVSWQD